MDYRRTPPRRGEAGEAGEAGSGVEGEDRLSGSLQTDVSEQQQHRGGDTDRRSAAVGTRDAARRQPDLFVWKDVWLVALTQISLQGFSRRAAHHVGSTVHAVVKCCNKPYLQGNDDTCFVLETVTYIIISMRLSFFFMEQYLAIGLLTIATTMSEIVCTSWTTNTGLLTMFRKQTRL